MRNTDAFLSACEETFLYDAGTVSGLRRKVNHRENTKPFKGAYRTVDVSVEGKRVGEYVHRIVWMMHNGLIPEGMVIDHIDRDKLNNDIMNLRCVDRSVNRKNTDSVNMGGAGRQPTVHTGKVCYKDYGSEVHVYTKFPNGRSRNIGWFRTLEDAKAMGRKARRLGLLKD